MNSMKAFYLLICTTEKKRSDKKEVQRLMILFS
jgi:hypothetical protein